jgi:hypothetical protein
MLPSGRRAFLVGPFYVNQAPVLAHDIGRVRSNADGADKSTFVLRKDIDASTVISFTTAAGWPPLRSASGTPARW